MKKPLTIGFAYDLETEYELKTDDPPDAKSEFDTQETINLIVSSLRESGFRVIRIGNYFHLLKNIKRIKNTVDLVFNLTEGVSGRNREGQVPTVLESFDIPFVGSDALTMNVSLDKVITKKALITDHIPTAKYMSVSSKSDIKNLGNLSFPLFVKPRWEGSSKGITRSSRVNNLGELTKQTLYIIHTYKQPALVEEFIRGNEYTVPLIDNQNVTTLPIIQISVNNKTQLRDNFYLNDYIDTDEVTYLVAQNLKPGLKRLIESLAIKAYKSIDCRDYARVDFRVDEKGAPFVLEINPIPALHKSDAFCVAAYACGLDYKGLIGKIVDAALSRYHN